MSISFDLIEQLLGHGIIAGTRRVCADTRHSVSCGNGQDQRLETTQQQ